MMSLMDKPLLECRIFFCRHTHQWIKVSVAIVLHSPWFLSTWIFEFCCNAKSVPSSHTLETNYRRWISYFFTKVWSWLWNMLIVVGLLRFYLLFHPNGELRWCYYVLQCWNCVLWPSLAFDFCLKLILVSLHGMSVMFLVSWFILYLIYPCECVLFSHFFDGLWG
jgi:uncharacterized membrane protein YkvI